KNRVRPYFSHYEKWCASLFPRRVFIITRSTRTGGEGFMAATRMLFLAVACALALASAAASADMELRTPDGRRVLLKDDGTWRYADDSGAAGPGEKKPEGEAVLSLEGKIEGNRICRLQLRLVNNLPYEIRSLVPELSIYRPNGVVYDSLFA